jgi:hypothetical protein
MMPKRCQPNDDPTMRGCRSRNEGDGQLRQKRGDTLAVTIEEQYDVDLGVRGDTRLRTLRALARETSIEGVIEKLGRSG